MAAELIPKAHFIQSAPTMGQETPPCSPNKSGKYLKQENNQMSPQNQQAHFPLQKARLPTNSTVINWEKYRQYYDNITTQTFSPCSFTQPSQKILEQRTNMSQFTLLKPWPEMTQRTTPCRPVMAAQLTLSIPTMVQKTSKCSPSMPEKVVVKQTVSLG
ncbi:unnamed protein product [Ceratitis capitata]|uniref:(Mediterranean fruit fly) hypothetical protein n=1 Tax=Ceratitis capitata TaxID=7213 RepID=A0A811UHT8_CERCA|nr:unnamed protein product [Ceratitis capitata]